MARERLASRLQSEGERLARNARHKRTDEPSQGEGNAARQSNRLALHVGAPVTIEKSPVRVKSPEESAVVTDWMLMFLWRTWIRHFRDAQTVNAALCPIGTEVHKARLVLRVDHDRDDLLHVEPQVHTKHIAVA